MILFIDSAKIDEITIKLLEIPGEETLTIKTKNIRGSQVVLSSIQQILEKNKKALEDITSIEVYEGGGSYTGRRVGAAIANAFSYVLTIPVNRKPLGEFVYPSYE